MELEATMNIQTDKLYPPDERYPRLLQQVIRHLIETYRPQQIILYGSLAYGTPDPDSDIDLLIIKDTDASPLERRVRVRRLASTSKYGIPFSPLVLTPDELAQRLTMEDPFYQDIIKRGKVLYSDA
jgi:predicted nucleotidyltransferase